MRNPYAKKGLKFIIIIIAVSIAVQIIGSIFSAALPDVTAIGIVASVISSLILPICTMVGYAIVGKDSIGFKTAFHCLIGVIVVSFAIAIMTTIGASQNIPWLINSKASFGWIVVLIEIIAMWFVTRGCYEVTGNPAIERLAKVVFGCFFFANILGGVCQSIAAFEQGVLVLSAIANIMSIVESILLIILFIITYRKVE